MSDSLLLENGALWAGPDYYWPKGVLEIRNGKVSFAGPAESYQGREGFVGPRLDAGGGLIMPGLVNAHCHAPMVLFRGMADDLPLAVWLGEHMFPAEARWVNEEMTELCGLLAAAEMLLSGTTCVGDAYFCAGGAARAFERAGLRAVVAQGVIDFPAPGAPDPGQGLEVARRFVEEWQERSPLIRPALFAHSVYTCSPEKLKGVAALARETGAPWFTHLSETREEAAQVRQTYGTTPARHLEALGLLAGLQAAAHGVWLDREEIELVTARGVSLVHCPESNRKLASGLADVAGWLRAGAAVGLGTDGAASNNDLDMIAEIRSAALGDKLKNMNPASLPAAQALDLAWEGSARALGLQGRVGRLLPGFAGDAVVLDLDQPHLTPFFDAASALVYAGRGSDVRHAVVAGRLAVRDRRVLGFDLPEVMARVKSLARQVMGHG